MKINEEIPGLEDIEDEDKSSIKPYMSEEIHSILQAMGEYLIDKDEEAVEEIVTKKRKEELDDEADISQNLSSAHINPMSEYEIKLERFREKLNEVLKGRVLIEHIMTRDGEYIGREGETVTEHMIQIAKENGCMIKIIMHSK